MCYVQFLVCLVPSFKYRTLLASLATERAPLAMARSARLPLEKKLEYIYHIFVFARRGLAGVKRPRRAERAITSGARVLYLKLGTRQTKNYTYQ